MYPEILVVKIFGNFIPNWTFKNMAVNVSFVTNPESCVCSVERYSKVLHLKCWHFYYSNCNVDCQITKFKYKLKSTIIVSHKYY